MQWYSWTWNNVLCPLSHSLMFYNHLTMCYDRFKMVNAFQLNSVLHFQSQQHLHWHPPPALSLPPRLHQNLQRNVQILNMHLTEMKTSMSRALIMLTTSSGDQWRNPELVHEESVQTGWRSDHSMMRMTSTQHLIWWSYVSMLLVQAQWE